MKKNYKTFITSAIALFALLPTMTSCGFTYCQHKIETIKGEPATCQATGIKSYYKCELCGQIFGYDRFGLYEIDAPEVDDNGKHDLVYLPASRGYSNDISRVKYTSTCKQCNEQFEIDEEDLIKFAPGTNIASDLNGASTNSYVTAKHIQDNKTVATVYSVKAGTKKSNKTTIWRTGDSPLANTDNLYETSIPFVSNVVTDTMLMFKNESSQDIKIKYANEDYGQRSWAIDASGSDIITIKSNSVTPVYFPIKSTNTNPGSCHELYMESDIEVDTKITIWGAFLPSKLDSIFAAGGKLSYKVGERFSTKDLVLMGNYLGQNPKTKELPIDECDISLRGKVLTLKDKTVKVTYKGVSSDITISVYDPNDLRSIQFAKKPQVDYVVGEEIDYSRISLEAVYGENRTLSYVPLTLEDVEFEKIEGPLTMEHNKKVITFTYQNKSVSMTLNVKEAQ